MAEPHEKLARFLRTQLRPDDRAAVMVFNRLTPFTADGERLAGLVERARVMPKELGDSLARSAQQGDFTADDNAAIDKWLQSDAGRLPFLRKASSLALGTAAYQESGFAQRRLDAMLSVNLLMQVTAGAEYLRNQPGEKRLVLMAPRPLRPLDLPGFPAIDNEAEERQLALHLADAEIAFDIIDTIGQETPVISGRSPSELSTMSGQNMALLTGGQFTSARPIDQQLARIEESSRFGYVIGYVPTDGRQDGKYRQIAIRVNRRDVTLAYRRGYTPRPDAAPVGLRDVLVPSRLEAGAAAPTDVTDLRIQATAAVVGDTNRQVRLQLTIDPARLALTERDGIRQGTINLLVLCGDSRRTVIGKLDQPIPISLDAAEYQDALKAGIRYAATIPVTGQPTQVKVIVYDFDSDQLGSKSIRVR